MQTIPTFAYLIPMLLLFGNSPVSAMIATGHLRDAADGAGDHARPVAGAAGDRAISATWRAARARQKLWRVLRAVGAADADGRRQPGHHAGAQHGDHLLDDRRRRPRLRRAAGAAGAEGRRRRWRPGSRSSSLAIALDRLSQASPPVAAPRRIATSRRRLLAAPSQPRRSRLAILVVDHAAQPVRPGLRRGAQGDHLHHRADVEGGGRLDHHQFLRCRSRRSASRCILYVLNPVRAFCEGLPVARRRCSCSALPATGSAACGSRAAGRGADRLLRGRRACGKRPWRRSICAASRPSSPA